MDFGFTAEQEELRRAAREFFEAETPVRLAREMLEDPVGVSEQAWKKLAELGWTGICVAERYGGSGLGLLELSLVMEEAGRVVLALPLASTAAMAVPAISRLATEAQQERLLPELAAGRTRATLAIAEQSGRWEASGVQARGESAAGGWVLSGEKWFVPDARSADLILVVAGVGEGLGVFVVGRGAEGLELEPLQTVDGTRKLDLIRLEGVALPSDALLGETARPAGELDALVDVAKTALAAEMCGLAGRALEMSVEYAKVREQFGRPIGSFQAIQHKLADMKVGLENARSLVYYAAWALDCGAPDARLAAAMAKAYASDVCPAIIADAVQVHGGIGFTWEHDLHLYLKRANADAVTCGDADENRELVASLLPTEAQ
ncbi:MAG: acyl-CoA dehydrogenase [Candidatus Dadabacteria bacterium]|nr:MAG: acyl-CoA dehydrogenase [Candidatus Dadabacteria bacterium]